MHFQTKALIEMIESLLNLKKKSSFSQQDNWIQNQLNFFLFGRVTIYSIKKSMLNKASFKYKV